MQTRPHTKTEIEMAKTTPQTTRRNTAQTLDALLTRIAQEHLFIDTLETRKSDSLDFHDCQRLGRQGGP